MQHAPRPLLKACESRSLGLIDSTLCLEPSMNIMHTDAPGTEGREIDFALRTTCKRPSLLTQLFKSSLPSSVNSHRPHVWIQCGASGYVGPDHVAEVRSLDEHEFRMSPPAQTGTCHNDFTTAADCSQTWFCTAHNTASTCGRAYHK